EALLNKSYVYAMQKHGQQKRASVDPYISHPLEVAAILAEQFVDLGARRRRIFDRIVQKGERDRRFIEMHVGEERSDLER
ncbi:bifunctional (p)ppGpp synthetase/guanosine-3',5'-bis(diphosphate) 3'-pyrophosphohydrolase, partial [Rhizobium ruizarguesonis]